MAQLTVAFLVRSVVCSWMNVSRHEMIIAYLRKYFTEYSYFGLSLIARAVSTTVPSYEAVCVTTPSFV